MAKSVAERSAEWRRRLLLKSSIFDDLNAERAARIRQAFPGDERPEVRAVVEFFANYPRCQNVPRSIELRGNTWWIGTDELSVVETAAAVVSLQEVTSMSIATPGQYREFVLAKTLVRDEVAEMRALGLWGRS